MMSTKNSYIAFYLLVFYLLQKEKTKNERLHSKLKIRVLQNRKKAKEIQERKQDLDGYFIKPCQNVFDVLF